MPYSKNQLRKLLSADLIPAKDQPHLTTRAAETVIKRQIFRVEDAAVLELEARYKAAFKRIQMAMLSDGERNRAWLNNVMATVTPVIQRLTTDSAAIGLRAAHTAWLGGCFGRLWLLDMATHPEIPINKPTQDALLDMLREDVYDDLVHTLLGRDWRAQFADQLDTLVPQIKLAISTGMSAGEGITDIMRRVRGVMGVETDRRRTGDTYRANFNRVQTMVRTIVNTASNNGAAAAYAANADVLAGQEWLTARDERVCPQCRGFNGRVEKVGSFFRPPAHPACRCSLIPVVKPIDQIEASEPPRQTFGEWAVANGLSLALQQFMSPRRETERV